MDAIVKGLRSSFNSGKNKTLKYRKSQLESLLQLTQVEEDVFKQAVTQDLRKPGLECVLLELETVRNAVRGMILDMDTWAADEYVEKNFVTLLDTTYIHREPLGVVLVLSAWNYPVQLSLLPVAAAIAAGNTVILKPSELAPATSAALKRTIASHMDPDVVTVIEGGVPETQSLLKHRFDYIFYTGSTNVGRIIANAAAVHLTPTTLELGGKSPLYVDSDVNMEVAAKRLVWGKCIGLGQTCVAPDYVICNQKAQDKLLVAVKKVYAQFYGDVPQDSPDLARVVNSRHFDRLYQLTQKTNGDLVMGGNCIEKDLFMDLHVYTNVQANDALMLDEIFGPILPIVVVDSVHEAIEFINSKEKPLSLYIFSNKKCDQQKMIDETSSGSVCVNDVIVHLSVETLPFGGVGNSGYGAYHGKDSFDTFSHRKSVLVRDFGFIGENLGRFRYPPYTEQNIKDAIMLLKRRKFPSLPWRGMSYLAAMMIGVAIGIGVMQIIADA